jgi:hypothetical protein
MTRSRFAAVALAALLALGAAGCSPAAPTAQTHAAATGAAISGTGYRYSVPDGWGEPGEIPGFTPDTLAADLTDADGFSDNVNVLLSPAGLVDVETVETAGVAELEGIGAKNVTAQPRVSVDGAEAAHLTAALVQDDVTYLIDQFYVSDANQTYVITFSFSDTVPDAERDAITGSVLASWTFDV